jgi:hypothetical protein
MTRKRSEAKSKRAQTIFIYSHQFTGYSFTGYSKERASAALLK